MWGAGADCVGPHDDLLKPESLRCKRGSERDLIGKDPLFEAKPQRRGSHGLQRHIVLWRILMFFFYCFFCRSIRFHLNHRRFSQLQR